MSGAWFSPEGYWILMSIMIVLFVASRLIFPSKPKKRLVNRDE